MDAYLFIMFDKREGAMGDYTDSSSKPELLPFSFIMTNLKLQPEVYKDPDLIF